jgi:hypothetical protein
LRNLNDKVKEDTASLIKDLEIITSAHIFWDGYKQIKEKSSEFTDKDRLQMYGALDEDYWWTPNGDLLESLYEDFQKEISDEEKEKIEKWETKKIIFVLTDWEPNDARQVQKYTKKFREAWVLVYGIWITDEWISVIDLYTGQDEKLGYWVVCKRPEDLAKTLKDMLLLHLKNI